MLCLPVHSSRHFQPLDMDCFQVLETAHSKAIWRSNAGDNTYIQMRLLPSVQHRFAYDFRIHTRSLLKDLNCSVCLEYVESQLDIKFSPPTSLKHHQTPEIVLLHTKANERLSRRRTRKRNTRRRIIGFTRMEKISILKKMRRGNYRTKSVKMVVVRRGSRRADGAVGSGELDHNARACQMM